VSLSLFLQLFLLADVFFVGVLTTIAVQHARAHFVGQGSVPETPAPRPTISTPATPPPPVMTPMMRERLAHESQKHFEESVTAAVQQLQQNLGATATELDQLLRRLGGEIVGNELERYRVELSQLRQQAQADLGTIKTEITGHKAELEKQAADELAAEKQRLIKQIDTKLGDAVSSFLLDALGHDIDMGAQEQAVLAALEAHKADLKAEVGDEQPAA
jgi:hypothetical protein